jgi:hypothetical protein
VTAAAQFVPVSLSRTMAAVAAITAAMLASYPVGLYVAWHYHGRPGMAASTVAMLTCWVSATLASFGPWLTNRWVPVVGLLVALIVRVTIPLAVAVVLTEAWGDFHKVNGFGMMVAYFLYMVTWEAGISVWLVRGAQRPAALRNDSKAC